MYALVRLADRRVLSYGDTYAETADPPPAGVEVLQLNALVTGHVRAAFAGPNGGITVASDGTVTALAEPPPLPVTLLSDEIMLIPQIAALSTIVRGQIRVAVKRVVP